MLIPVQEPSFIRGAHYLLIGYLVYLGLRLSVLEDVRLRAFEIADAAAMFIPYRQCYRNVLVVSILITWTMYSPYPLAPPRLIVYRSGHTALKVVGIA